SARRGITGVRSRDPQAAARLARAATGHGATELDRSPPGDGRRVAAAVAGTRRDGETAHRAGAEPVRRPGRPGAARADLARARAGAGAVARAAGRARTADQSAGEGSPRLAPRAGTAQGAIAAAPARTTRQTGPA